MKSKELSTEIAVIGGGAAGLMTTKKLSELGFDVTLVDKGPVLAGGPSTKNEGWLHRGSVHAGVITDPERAATIAQRLIYGYDQIMAFAPEAVEDLTSKTYALFRDPELAASTEQRWRDLDIWYQSVHMQSFLRANQELNPEMIARAYLVKDKSLNFRLLYQKLLAVSESYGAKIVLNRTVVPDSEGRAALVGPDGQIEYLSAETFVYTTGLAASEIFKSLGSPLSARFWKSHSVILPKISKNGYFFVDPLEASIMPHGDYAIACKSEDDYEIDEPTFEVNPEMAHLVFDALVRMIPEAEKYADTYISSACVKPDIIHGPNSPRSVDIEIHEPVPNTFVAFPGKVTESPFMADTLVKKIFDRKSDSRIALRPGDTMNTD